MNSEAVLDAIELQQGILVERARDTYSFSHLTLQEYLTAKYIVDNQQVDCLVENYLTDERWREVFLLAAEFMPGRTGADTLLEKMEQQAQVYIAKPKLQALLQWANEVTDGSESSIQPVAKRTAAIALPLCLSLAIAVDRTVVLNIAFEASSALVLAFAFNLNLVCAFALNLDFKSILNRDRDRDLPLTLNRNLVLDLNLVSEFEKAKILKPFDASTLRSTLEKMRQELPDNDAPLSAVKAFIEQIWQTWFGAIGLDAETAMFSEEEADALSNYLYANELIIRCKEAAVRISADTWAGIEDRMLRVTD